MKKTIITYSFDELEPYINWPYFYHAWNLDGKPESERIKMKNEAINMLHSLSTRFMARAIFCITEACGDGDDIVLSTGQRIPTLRQQQPAEGCNYTLCLADFLRPADYKYGEPDQIGIFATTVDTGMVEEFKDDVYLSLLSQTLADRLAEAAAERMHYQVRTQLWGYAPDEEEDIQRILAGKYQGIRPAVGYPSMPDTSLNFVLDKLIHFADIGVQLTESGMMIPHASVSGLMISHPKARYFNLGKIGHDQLADYASRRELPVDIVKKFLASHLISQ